MSGQRLDGLEARLDRLEKAAIEQAGASAADATRHNQMADRIRDAIDLMANRMDAFLSAFDVDPILARVTANYESLADLEDLARNAAESRLHSEQGQRVMEKNVAASGNAQKRLQGWVENLRKEVTSLAAALSALTGNHAEMATANLHAVTDHTNRLAGVEALLTTHATIAAGLRNEFCEADTRSQERLEEFGETLVSLGKRMGDLGTMEENITNLRTEDRAAAARARGGLARADWVKGRLESIEKARATSLHETQGELSNIEEHLRRLDELSPRVRKLEDERSATDALYRRAAVRLTALDIEVRRHAEDDPHGQEAGSGPPTMKIHARLNRLIEALDAFHGDGDDAAYSLALSRELERPKAVDSVGGFAGVTVDDVQEAQERIARMGISGKDIAAALEAGKEAPDGE